MRGDPLGAAIGVCAAAAISLVVAPAARAGDEFHAYGIEQYSKNNDGCAGKDLEHARNQAIEMHWVFDDWDSEGDWDQSLYFSDNEVDGGDFSDYFGSGNCENWQDTCSPQENDEVDDFGADAADVAYLSTHGGYDGADNSLSWVMGDNDDDCSVKTNAGYKAGNMIWDDDLDILIVDACNSARYPIWNDSYDEPRQGITTMIGAGSTLSTLLGYHGTTADREWGADFAEDSYEDGVGENWVLQGTDFGGGAGDSDLCAVGIVFGDDPDARLHMFEWGGFADREDTGDREVGSTYFYIEGCAPNGAMVIGS